MHGVWRKRTTVRPAKRTGQSGRAQRAVRQSKTVRLPTSKIATRADSFLKRKRRDAPAQRHNPNVLWVFFEDLATDLRAEVVRVARFAGIDAPPALVDAAVRVSSFESMASKEHRRRAP